MSKLYSQLLLSVILLGAGAQAQTVLSGGVRQTILDAEVDKEIDDQGCYQIVFDLSWSMHGQKLDDAKNAVLSVGKKVPSQAKLGIRAFGGVTKTGCDANMGLIAPASGDRQNFAALVNGLQARGKTPLDSAIKEAGFRDMRPRCNDAPVQKLIVVTDGRDTCHGDPCGTAEMLSAMNPKLQIEVIGYRIDDAFSPEEKEAARKELRCIAHKGKGHYYDATEADLAGKIVQSFHRRVEGAVIIPGQNGAKPRRVVTEEFPVATTPKQPARYTPAELDADPAPSPAAPTHGALPALPAADGASVPTPAAPANDPVLPPLDE